MTFRKKIAKLRYDMVGQVERFDEADHALARGGLQPDSDLWQTYYGRHPKLEAEGREWAGLPGYGHVGPLQDTLMYDSMIWTISSLGKEECVDGTSAPNRLVMEPRRASEKIKGFARQLGAEMVRIGPLHPAWVYSRVGRAPFPDRKIGTEIHLPHQHAVVIALRHDLKMIRWAPKLPSTLETTRAYLQLASIVVVLAKYIRSLGYSTRAHNLWNYQVLLIPLAVDAGLGELGRGGLLVSAKYGSAIRLAAVTTAMPLMHDPIVGMNIDEFCADCKVCAKSCPVGAIPTGEKQVVRGVRKWKTNDSACYGYMRKIGTNCGICLAVCPHNNQKESAHASLRALPWLEEQL